MEMARERQAEEVPDDDTYLVCPLRDDEVEAIRAKAYKSREKTLAQERKAARLRKREIEKRELKERRRLREAGEFVPDSGVSCVDDLKEFREFSEAYNDPLLYTQFVRRQFYWQLNREQMQRAVAWYFGWDKWSEDPWGSYPRFCEWIVNAHDNEMAVWAVNETSMGRDYLVRGILEGLGQLDYSEMTEKDLLTQIGYGAACFLHTKNYTGWDNFLNHYPKEPLPVRLVNGKVSTVYPFDFKLPYSEMTLKPDGSFDIPERVRQDSLEELEDFFCLFIDARNYGPFTSYRFLISGIYLWYRALNEIEKKTKEHPEIKGIIVYKTDSDSYIAELCKRLAPKDYRLADRSTSMLAIWKVVLPLIHPIYRKHLFPMHEGLPDTDAGQEGLIRLDAEVKKLAQKKLADLVTAGRTGILRDELRDEAQRGIDAVRKREVRRLAHEITIGKTTEDGRSESALEIEADKLEFRRWKESQQTESEGTPDIADLGLDLANLPLEKLPTLRKLLLAVALIPPEQATTLDKLGLDFNTLSPKEFTVLQSVISGFRKGYRFDSKQGKPFKEYWGKEYQANKKAWERVNRKYKDGKLSRKS